MEWPSRTFIFALAAAVALGITAATAAAPTSFVSVGSGAISGLYYPVARALCDLVNRGRRAHGVRCSAEPTSGSVFNVDGLQTGDLDLALVQSDVQFAAYQGAGQWQGAPYSGLRSILSLYPELVTVLARPSAQVDDVEHPGVPEVAGHKVAPQDARRAAACRGRPVWPVSRLRM